MIVIKVLISIVLCAEIWNRFGEKREEGDIVYERMAGNFGTFLNICAYIGAIYFIFN